MVEPLPQKPSSKALSNASDVCVGICPNWQMPPVNLVLGATDLHLWRIDLQAGGDVPFWDCLSEDEVTRAERYRFDRDRIRFVQSRGSLRHILSRYLNHSPESIDFTYGQYGKPSCGTDLSFNLSHSSSTALCAVARHRRVGIDVEKYREITHFESLVRRCLSKEEIPTLEQLPKADRQTVFLQYWTGKEAYLKAIGCGLTQSLTDVSLQLTPPKLLKMPEAGDWYLYPIPMTHAAASVVVEGITTQMPYIFSIADA